jgi:hypothetical protein
MLDAVLLERNADSDDRMPACKDEDAATLRTYLYGTLDFRRDVHLSSFRWRNIRRVCLVQVRPFK